MAPTFQVQIDISSAQLTENQCCECPLAKTLKLVHIKMNLMTVQQIKKKQNN